MEAKQQEDPNKLPFQLLKHITGDFDVKRILGSGAFGTVYKGVHENLGEIAVKVLHNISGFDGNEFHKEFNNLKGLRHQNIVELMGYCDESVEELVEFDGKQVRATRMHMALCFEYVQNGSLSNFISDECTGLTWHTRYRIIKGICEGLKYLREGLEHPIMHFDLKPDNILLDKDMVPKVADFGLARLLGEENTKKTMSSVGTIGYWPPEYIKHQIISKEFDIFSLGVIIIKIMVGKEGYTRIVEMGTTKYVKHVCENWKTRLRPTLSHLGLLEVYSYQVKRCIEIALQCLKSNRQERPTIQYIVSSLNEVETGDHQPQIEQFYQDDGGESTLASRSSMITSGPSSGHAEASRSTHREGYLPAVGAKFIELEELIHLTDGFSEELLLGKGVSGMVYKGVYEDGQALAVKVLNRTRGFYEGYRFTQEFDCMLKIENENIVRLAGYCHKILQNLEGKSAHVMICFEYLPNGSLEKHISGIHSGLDWRTRYGIIKGTCEGLRYLHKGMPRAVYHLNLKPSNILLDENMVPKIGDFSVSRFADGEDILKGAAKKGSIEYMPREFIENQVITEKYDIYSLGVVITEIMTGHKPCLRSIEMSSKKYFDLIHENWRNRLRRTVRGTSLEGYCLLVKACLKIARSCVEPNIHKRPAIGYILNILEETEFLIQKEFGCLDAGNSFLLLHVHPLDLHFSFTSEPRKKTMISCSLQLSNSGDDRVAFMLVANSPRRYMTKLPFCRVVQAGCAYTIVLARPNKLPPPSLSSSSSDNEEDFFTLYSIAVGEYDLLDVDEDYASVKYSNFFKEVGETAAEDEVQEVRLKVICDGPPADQWSSVFSFASKLLSFPEQPTRSTVEIVTTPDAQRVSSIDVHPTEPWLMTTNHLGSLGVWNYHTMATVSSIQAAVSGLTVYAAKFIAREKWIVTGDRNGGIHVYSYSKGKDVMRLDAHSSCITTLVVHPTHSFVFSSSEDDHRIKLWDWHKGWECTRTFQGHTGRVTQLKFNTAGTGGFASASLDGTVKVWSIICSDDHSNIMTLDCKVESVLSVDYFTRHDRPHLIAGCKDRNPQIWDLRIMEGCVHELEGHADHISAVNLHPELPILITGSLDGTVRIWNSTTYAPLNIISFNLGAVYAFACIKGSTRIVVGCHQGIATMEISLA